MAIDPVVVWNLSDILSAIILLASLVLMVKFYREYLDVDLPELQDWKLITIGFAFYIAIKTHTTLLSELFGVDPLAAGPAQYPWYVMALLSVILLTASLLVFLGFYGLVKDYL